MYGQSTDQDSTVNATSRDYYGFTSFMSYARLVLSACSKDPLPSSLLSPLPPRHLATMTIQHYLDYIYTLLPFFDETSLYYSIDSVYKAANDAQPMASSFDHWCVRMILAVSNGWMSEKCGDECHLEAMGHVAAALQHAEHVLRPGSITSVQALIFLAQYAMVDPHHFDSWSLIGAASRAMVDLGLHQDPPRGSTLPKAKLDLRRRIFWCVYTMDRTVSIVQTRSFSFSDDSAHVSMPYTGQQGPKTSSYASRWLKSFEHARDIVNFRKLQSKWYQDLFQSGREAWSQPFPYLWQTCHNLATCFNDQSKRSAAHHDWFELELLYSYVYLLSPSPRVPTTHPYVQNLIFEHCVSYAQLMSKAINTTTDLVPVSFYDAMRVYMTGRQFLDLLNQNMNHVLSGIHADPPTVSSNSPPPPAIPCPPVDAYTNTTRAINCITQLRDALDYLGKRWGYSSWRDNFDKVAEPILAILRNRLWEYQQTANGPQMMRHSSSNNSVPTVYSYDYSQQSPSHIQVSNDSGSLPTMASFDRPPSFSMYAAPGSVTGAQLRAARQSFAIPPMQHLTGMEGYGSVIQTDSIPPMPVGYQQGLEEPVLQFAAWGGLDQNRGHVQGGQGR